MSGVLATLGGLRRFDEPLHVGRPNLGNEDEFLRRVKEILERRWLTNHGPLLLEFEDRLRTYLGVRNAIAVCNATVGLELVLRALDVRGTVVVPSYTFVASAHAPKWLGLEPIFCDVDRTSHCVQARDVEAVMDRDVGAVMGVHLWGRSCDTDGLSALARDRGIPLVLDAAHALGCTANGVSIGGGGSVEVFSFHATKFFNTFEGGVITTNDDDLARRIFLMGKFGFDGIDNVTMLGTNAKMSEVSAAMGLTMLESIDEIVKVNRRNFELYRDRLSDVPGLKVVPAPEGERWNYQYVVVEVDRSRTGICRDCVVRVLHAENVIARRYFHPGCHRSQPYVSRENIPRLPVTEELCEVVLVLPTGTAVSTGDIEAVCDIIREAVANAEELEAALHAAL